MSSGEYPANFRKTYDDISYDMRKKLIDLIDKEKWTIRAAAEQIGIKLCTAKYILYLFRKFGKIYRKKGGNHTKDVDGVVADREPGSLVYVPYPFYVFYFNPAQTMPINLECFEWV